MKLSEALAERADLRVRLAEIERRLQANVLVQEGDRPAEDPQELLGELHTVLQRLNFLMVQINKTNGVARLSDGRLVTEALAQRDVLRSEINIVRKVAQEASPTGRFSYRTGRSEIKFVPTVDIAVLNRMGDRLQREHRVLDSAIQMANFTHDLIEES